MKRVANYDVFRKAGLFLILFSLIFLIVGGMAIVTTLNRHANCTYELDAIVVENKLHRGTHNSYDLIIHSYTPVFEFDYNGHTYQVSSNVSTSPPRYQLDEPVRLKINPDNPYQILEVGSIADIILISISLFIGIASLVGGILFYRKYKALTWDRKYWRYE